MKIITGSYASNIEYLRKVIGHCKKCLMAGKPLEKFPHYWALIPIEPRREQYGRKPVK